MLPGGCGERGPGRRGALPAEAAGLAGGCSVVLKALLQIPERLPICLAQELVCGRRAGKQTPAPSCGRAGGPLGPLGLGAGAGPKAQSQGRLDIPGEILAAASEETDWRILPRQSVRLLAREDPCHAAPPPAPPLRAAPTPCPLLPSGREMTVGSSRVWGTCYTLGKGRRLGAGAPPRGGLSA